MEMTATGEAVSYNLCTPCLDHYMQRTASARYEQPATASSAAACLTRAARHLRCSIARSWSTGCYRPHVAKRDIRHASPAHALVAAHLVKKSSQNHNFRYSRAMVLLSYTISPSTYNNRREANTTSEATQGGRNDHPGAAETHTVTPVRKFK